MALTELRPRSSACRVASPNVLLLGAAENSDYAKTLVDGTSAFQVDFIIIIIIIIYNELGLDRPVSTSSNSLFKGLLNHLCPFGLQFSIIFDILLFILVTFRSQFDFYLLSFSSTGSIFNTFEISSFLLSERMYLAIHLQLSS